MSEMYNKQQKIESKKLKNLKSNKLVLNVYHLKQA